MNTSGVTDKTLKDSKKKKGNQSFLSSKTFDWSTLRLRNNITRMQHFAQNKEDFGQFLQNPHVTYFVIRIRKRRTIVSFYNNTFKPKISHKCK